MNINQAKQQVIQVGLKLQEEGLVARTWGNVSCRVDENTFAITPSGKKYDELTIDDIVVVACDTLKHLGDVKPSSEKGLHSIVYQKYKDVNFVIHTHQDQASIIAASGVNKINVEEEYKSLGTSIPCAKYALPGTKKLIKNVNVALEQNTSPIVIMKNHGVLAFAKDEVKALELAMALEAYCELYIENKQKSFVNKGSRERRNSDNKTCEGSIKKLLPEDTFKCMPIIFNSHSDILTVGEKLDRLRPMLDDFAQIIGSYVPVVESMEKVTPLFLLKHPAVIVKGYGGICLGANKYESEAISMILEKGCKAYLGSQYLNSTQYINPLECKLMRFVYKKKYSKQAE